MLTQRELATVLAALRFWQDEVLDNHGVFGARDRMPDIFCDIEPLTREEVDELCEKLNFDEEHKRLPRPSAQCASCGELTSDFDNACYEDGKWVCAKCLKKAAEDVFDGQPPV